MNQVQVPSKLSRDLFGDVSQRVSRHQKNMEMLLGFATEEVVRDRQGNILETKVVPAKKPVKEMSRDQTSN